MRRPAVFYSHICFTDSFFDNLHEKRPDCGIINRAAIMFGEKS